MISNWSSRRTISWLILVIQSIAFSRTSSISSLYISTYEIWRKFTSISLIEKSNRNILPKSLVRGWQTADWIKPIGTMNRAKLHAPLWIDAGIRHDYLKQFILNLSYPWIHPQVHEQMHHKLHCEWEKRIQHLDFLVVYRRPNVHRLPILLTWHFPNAFHEQNVYAEMKEIMENS